MQIYIPMEIIQIVLAILGACVLIYLIITLNNINKLLNNVNTIVSDNRENVKIVIDNLPVVVENCNEITDSVKDITSVATDVTADFIVTKENVQSNVDLILEVINIIKQVFIK